MRLECPLNCVGYTIKASNTSNSRGSFGADSCSYISGWVESGDSSRDIYHRIPVGLSERILNPDEAVD